MVNIVDAKVSYLVNRGWSNPFLDAAMPIISELGTGETLFLVTVLIFILRRRKDKGRLSLLLFAGLAVTYYVVYFIKAAVARPRPYMSMPYIVPFVAEKGFSFPSHHAAQAFAAATIASGFFRRWRVALFAAAGLVAFSRVYLGVHFLSDVAAGAAVGIAVGYAILAIGRQSLFTASGQPG
jgi:undecaprenyl-diphosphatase